MQSLILVASLFINQPITTQTDSTWLELASIQAQSRATVLEDVRNVSASLQTSLRESIQSGVQLGMYTASQALTQAPKAQVANAATTHSSATVNAGRE